MKKSQSSIEFIILIGAMFFLFISLLFVFQVNLSEKAKEKRNLEVQEIALQVQNEIKIAAEATNGYQRTFNIPEKILNIDYGIILTDNLVYINTTDGKHALALQVQNVNGQLQKGDNTIKKTNETVYLNS